MTKTGRLAALTLLILTSVARADTTTQIAATLDGFHAAAEKADSAAYFDHMSDDMVFLGTDGSERWQGQQFREFVVSRFDAGQGWSYQPLDRNIAIGPDGNSAWFDESLSHATLGNCRGSGVLVLQQGQWKIAQYNLSVPVPNAVMDDVVAAIAQFESGPGTAVTDTGGTEADSTEAAQPASSSSSSSKCTRKGHKSNRVAGC